jgi:MFS family permease
MRPPQIAGLPRAFWFLLGGVFIARLGACVAPFLAIYLREQRGLSVEQVGLMLSLHALGAIGASMAGGWMTDRVGRKATMLVSLTVGPACLLWLSGAHGALEIGAASFAAALGLTLIRPAIGAAVADLVPAADRARAYGLLYWAVNVAFAVAPVMAGFVAKSSFRTLFFIDAGAALLFAAIIAAGVPETRPPPAATSAHPVRGAAAHPFADRTFLGFGLAVLLVQCTYQQALSNLPLYMSQTGVPPERYGMLMSLNGITVILVQPFAADLLKRFAAAPVLAGSALLIGGGFGMAGLGEQQALYAASIIVWTLGEIGMAPLMPTVVAGLASERSRGAYQGGLEAIHGGAAMLGPLAGGVVLAGFGPRALWACCLIAGVAAAAVFLMIGPALARRAARSAEPVDQADPAGPPRGVDAAEDPDGDAQADREGGGEGRKREVDVGGGGETPR